jgi:septal ring factor EnvC (AmiA/AmiB activator)
MPATDHFRWNQQKLHAVFAASSVVLLLAVYAMLRQDQADEWRGVQRNVFAIDAEMRRNDRARLEGSPEYEQLQQVRQQLSEATKETDAQKQANAELFRKLSQQERTVESLEIDLKFRNSDRDEARANLDLAVRDGLAEEVMAARKAEFELRQQRCDERQKELDAAREELAKLSAEAKAITATVDQLEADKTKLSAEYDRINGLLETIAPSNAVSAFKRTLMEMPIIDGFNSHLKVVQDWLPTLEITLGMSKIARFDR